MATLTLAKEVGIEREIGKKYVDSINEISKKLNLLKTQYKKEGKQRIILEFADESKRWPRYNEIDFYPDDKSIKYIKDADKKIIIETAVLIRFFPSEIKETRKIQLITNTALKNVENFKQAVDGFLAPRLNEPPPAFTEGVLAPEYIPPPPPYSPSASAPIGPNIYTNQTFGEDFGGGSYKKKKRMRKNKTRRSKIFSRRRSKKFSRRHSKKK